MLRLAGLIAISIALGIGTGYGSTSPSPWFPLVLPWDDASPTLLDASDLLLLPGEEDPAGVIDARGPVVVGPDGHFVFQNTGQRAKFWGTNLAFSANFPPSPAHPPQGELEFPDPQAAEKLAARLAKLGFNAVRLHMLDSPWGFRPFGLWHDPYTNTQALDPVQLARLDWLIYQLKRHGIYVDLNLHVGREFTPGDGVTAVPELQEAGLEFHKTVTLFDPVMIALQKDYARRLLDRVNPTRGFATPTIP